MLISITGSKRGFTLLELLVVLVIMLLLSSVVVMNLAPMIHAARLRAGARQVIAVLRYARSYAVTQQTDAMVLFDTERNGISVQVKQSGETGEAAWMPLTNKAGCFHALPEGITIDDVHATGVAEEGTADTNEPAGNTVTFSMLGQATDTTITLRNQRNASCTIRVDAITGRCEFIDKP